MTDFRVENHGSVVLLCPLTEGARAWVTEHLTHPETQHFGGAVVMEPRYVDDVVRGLVSDGLTVEAL